MSVRDKASEAGRKTRDTVNQAARDVRDGASRAYDRTREGARTGARKTGEGINENPFIALAGGLAIGAILGSLIPRSRKERELLSDVGRDLNTRAHGAYDAARQAGAQKLEERGITPEAAENAIRDVARGIGDAASQSATAATEAARNKNQ